MGRGLVYVSFCFVCSVVGIPTVCIFLVLGRLLMHQIAKICLKSHMNAYYILVKTYPEVQVLLLPLWSWSSCLGISEMIPLTSPTSPPPPFFLSFLSPQVRLKGLSLQRSRAVSFLECGWLYLKHEPPTLGFCSKWDKYSGKREREWQIKNQVQDWVWKCFIPVSVLTYSLCDTDKLDLSFLCCRVGEQEIF